MSKSVLISAVIAVLAIGGGAAFVLSNNSDDDDSSNNNSSQQTDNDNKNDEDTNTTANTANPLGIDVSSLNNTAYRVTVNTTDDDGRQTSAVVETDGNGNVRTSVTDQGQESVFLIVDGETYFNEPGSDTWIKTPSGQAPIDTSGLSLGFTADNIGELNDLTIDDNGTGPCSTGTCRIYSSTDPVTGETGTIKVDTRTNRLSDIETTSPNGERGIISYEYDAAITITVPENVSELNIGSDLDALLQDIPQ